MLPHQKIVPSMFLSLFTLQQSASPIRTIEGHGQFVAPDCQEHTSTATMEREHGEKGTMNGKGR